MHQQRLHQQDRRAQTPQPPGGTLQPGEYRSTDARPTPALLRSCATLVVEPCMTTAAGAQTRVHTAGRRLGDAQQAHDGTGELAPSQEPTRRMQDRQTPGSREVPERRQQHSPGALGLRSPWCGRVDQVHRQPQGEGHRPGQSQRQPRCHLDPAARWRPSRHCRQHSAASENQLAQTFSSTQGSQHALLTTETKHNMFAELKQLTCAGHAGRHAGGAGRH